MASIRPNVQGPHRSFHNPVVRCALPTARHKCLEARLIVCLASADNPGSFQNKLNIPADALAALAGGLHGSPSLFPADMLSQVADLPLTDGLAEYESRAGALAIWKSSLQKGVLPEASRVAFPADPFKTKFMVGP